MGNSEPPSTLGVDPFSKQPEDTVVDKEHVKGAADKAKGCL